MDTERSKTLSFGLFIVSCSIEITIKKVDSFVIYETGTDWRSLIPVWEMSNKLDSESITKIHMFSVGIGPNKQYGQFRTLHLVGIGADGDTNPEIIDTLWYCGSDRQFSNSYAQWWCHNQFDRSGISAQATFYISFSFFHPAYLNLESCLDICPLFFSRIVLTIISILFIVLGFLLSDTTSFLVFLSVVLALGGFSGLISSVASMFTSCYSVYTYSRSNPLIFCTSLSVILTFSIIFTSLASLLQIFLEQSFFICNQFTDLYDSDVFTCHSNTNTSYTHSFLVRKNILIIILVGISWLSMILIWPCRHSGTSFLHARGKRRVCDCFLVYIFLTSTSLLAVRLRRHYLTSLLFVLFRRLLLDGVSQ